PSMSTGCAHLAACENESAPLAQFRAPRISHGMPGTAAAASIRMTTSGSSTATSPSKSPARTAVRKAVTSARCRLRSPHGTRGRSPKGAARTAGKLPCCSGGASYQRSNVVKGNSEHVVQHEHEPLGGSQPVQYHEQREANCVGHEGLMLRVRPGCALRNR